jgi:hypothetical protein
MDKRRATPRQQQGILIEMPEGRNFNYQGKFYRLLKHDNRRCTVYAENTVTRKNEVLPGYMIANFTI